MKYLVKVGSLKFEQGTFSFGDVIDVTTERAALFDQNDIQAIPENIEEVKVMPVQVKKRRTAKAEVEIPKLTPEPDLAAEEPQAEEVSQSEAKLASGT